MLKTAAALAWSMAVAEEWLLAFGFRTAVPVLVTGALWSFVLVAHVGQWISPNRQVGRLWLALSGAGWALLAACLKAEELWHAVPAAYAASRRAALLSVEWLGVPWILLAVPVALVPSAVVLSTWVRGEGVSLRRAVVARGVAIGYFGVTLLACLRYGAGELTP